MKYPPTNERATALTHTMLEALHGCDAAYPASFNIRLPQTAQSLMDRGFVVCTHRADKSPANHEYKITASGRTAYRIARKLALGA